MSAILELKPIPGSEAAPAAQPAAPAEEPASPIVGIVTTMISNGSDMATLTKLYLKLRDGKADLAKKAATKMAPLNTSIDLLETHFLAKMLELGVDSLKNAEGTPYKTTKTSITVADNSAFVDYVLTRALATLPVSEEGKAKIKQHMIESGQLALIEARAAKTAVETHMEETKELPAGLNKRSEVTVNVKSS